MAGTGDEEVKELHYAGPLSPEIGAVGGSSGEQRDQIHVLIGSP